MVNINLNHNVNLPVGREPEEKCPLEGVAPWCHAPFDKSLVYGIMESWVREHKVPMADRAGVCVPRCTHPSQASLDIAPTEVRPGDTSNKGRAQDAHRYGWDTKDY